MCSLTDAYLHVNYYSYPHSKIIIREWSLKLAALFWFGLLYKNIQCTTMTNMHNWILMLLSVYGWPYQPSFKSLDLCYHLSIIVSTI